MCSNMLAKKLVFLFFVFFFFAIEKHQSIHIPERKGSHNRLIDCYRVNMLQISTEAMLIMSGAI